MEVAGRFDAARTRFRKDAKELAKLATSPRTRERLWRHLHRPRRLSVREQHAFFILVLLAAIADWAVGHAALQAWAPGALRAWDAGWTFAALGFLAAVAVPGTGTAALALLADPALAWPSILGSAAGAAAGAAVVFFIGTAAREHLDMAEHPWAGKFLMHTERFARKASYAGLAVLVAIPGLPRWVPIYLAGIVGLALSGLVLAVFAGSAVRGALVVFAADWFKGLL